MHKLLISILLLTLFSCSTNLNKEQFASSKQNETFQVNPVVIQKEDEGWGNNIKLSYTKSLVVEKAVIYMVNSTYENLDLGFEISVPTNGLTPLTIKSTGKNSNNFLHFLAKVYKQKYNPSATFVATIIANCMNMGDYVDSLHNQSNRNYMKTAQYKLFFQGKNENDYAELYLNINDTEHTIELKEKDEKYRPIIIKLLTKKSSVQ